MTELTALNIVETVDMIRRRAISPVELVKAHLDRIQALNPSLNCFITVMQDQALTTAREVEAKIQQGDSLGRLIGIPMAVKDLFYTRGVRTTAGSLFFSDFVPDEDADVVQMISEEGAILLGKLNMHEIALGLTNQNPHYGVCKNPWDLQRVPGGSSGGSAAALAAGLCQGSLGSDTGGSIRVPAALCGVVGLKPTLGRVSLRGVIPLSWNLDHVGPMGRCVEDVALLLQVINGYQPEDAYSASARPPGEDFLSDIRSGVKGWRLAIADDDHFTNCESEILTAVQKAAQVFKDLGAEVKYVPVSGGLEAARANAIMVVSDAAAFHQGRLQSEPEKFGADVRQRLELGASYTAMDYSLARRTQTLMRHQFIGFFKDFDLLITPTTPVPAPLDQGPDAVEQARILTRFTAPFNLTGLPALSLPCGFTSNNLPIGMQIVGAPWSEKAVLQAAYAYEASASWRSYKPLLDCFVR